MNNKCSDCKIELEIRYVSGYGINFNEAIGDYPSELYCPNCGYVLD